MIVCRMYVRISFRYRFSLLEISLWKELILSLLDGILCTSGETTAIVMVEILCLQKN